MLSAILTSCQHSPKLAQGEPQSWILSEQNPGTSGTSAKGQKIPSGGLSGLVFKSRDTSQGRVRLWSVTDRGPNAEVVEKKRPFLIPDFNPVIVEIELDMNQKTFQVVDRLPLKTALDRPLTGLPNLATDEVPVDLHGQTLALDVLGVDTEGLALDDQGHFWLCEEYRPSLLKVNAQGQVLARYLPADALTPTELTSLKKAWGDRVIKPVLPKELSDRRLNRGFEGLAFHQGYFVVSLQSPTDQKKTQTTWLIFDPKTEKSKLIYYPADKGKDDKIGDLHSDGKNILVVDQSKKIHKIEMPQTFDEITEGQLLQKELLIDLGKHSDIAQSFDHEKIEGLTQISPEVFALINDNDFGLTGNLTFSTGIAELQKDPRTEILLIKNAPVR